MCELAPVAQVILCCVSSNNLSCGPKNYTDLGMHWNLLAHGALGFCSHFSVAISTELAPAMNISLLATRYLPIASLMADCTSSECLKVAFLASGIAPTVLALSGEDKVGLDNALAINIGLLCYYSFQKKKCWGWAAAGAALLTYFFVPKENKLMYPIGLAIIDICANKFKRERPPDECPPTPWR